MTIVKINPSVPFAIIHISTLLGYKKPNIIYNRLSALMLYLDCYCNLITREQIEKDLRVQKIDYIDYANGDKLYSTFCFMAVL